MSESVKHQAEPMCKASSGTAQSLQINLVTSLSTASRARPDGHADARPQRPRGRRARIQPTRGGCCGTWGQPGASDLVVRGRLVLGGGPARSRLCAAARRRGGRPPRSAPPDRPAPGPRRNETARAGARDRQADAAPRQAVADLEPWHLCGWGESALPTASGNGGCLPGPVKCAYSVPPGSATPPLDRTRPTGT